MKTNETKKAKIAKETKNVKKGLKSVKYNVIGDDNNVIKNFIILVLSISAIVFAIFVITELTKKAEKPEKELTAGAINYEVVSVGTMLNRSEKDYYVMIYNTEDSKAVLYSTIMSIYSQKEDQNKLPIYMCDLNNKLNSSYYNVGNDNKSNPNAKSIDDLDLGALTLLQVKNNKIVKYIENFEEIKTLLK